MARQDRSSGSHSAVPGMECEYSSNSDTFRVFLRGSLRAEDLDALTEALKEEPRTGEQTILVIDALGVSSFNAAKIRESLGRALDEAMSRVSQHVILVTVNEDVLLHMRAAALGSMKLHIVPGRMEVVQKLNDLRGLTSLSGV